MNNPICNITINPNTIIIERKNRIIFYVAPAGTHRRARFYSTLVDYVLASFDNPNKFRRLKAEALVTGLHVKLL